MIKLIATDMDGTLLNSNHRISQENKNAIDFARANDIDFIVATGRAYYEAKETLDAVNLKTEIICLNGASSFDRNGKLLSCIKIAADDALFISQVFKKLNISYQIYTKNCLYAEDITEHVQAFIDLVETQGADAHQENIWADVNKRIEQGSIVQVNHIENYLNLDDNPTLKIIAISNDRQKLEAAKILLQENKNISITSSGINNLEIMDKKATKGSALTHYAKEKNISLDHTMTLGDNLNDLSMLEISKYAVAMKNGNPALQKIASYVSEKTNDDDGVAYMIRKLLKEINGVI